VISNQLSVIRSVIIALSVVMFSSPFTCRAEEEAKAGTLKVHRIFSSNMVIQRGEPIKVWRMEEARRAVEILERVKTLGQASDETEAGDETE
jgi:hypothetical protein